MARTLLLLVLVACSTIALMRFAPGYFADVREMDGRYARGARAELETERATRGAVDVIAGSSFKGILRGDWGQSREYGVPVAELIRPRLAVTCLLLLRGIAYGWTLALFAALLLGPVRGWAGFLGLPFTLLLAIPTGAMATLCLLGNAGGPVLVLALLLAARDFKFLDRVFRRAWNAPHLLHARAQGLRNPQLLSTHVIPNVLPQLRNLMSLSLVTALSAIVPVEVVFGVNGIGQLAWSAAMNRDLPVLMATTLLVATVVACTGLYSGRVRMVEA